MSSVIFTTTIRLASPIATPTVSLRKAAGDIVLVVSAKNIRFVFAVGIGGEETSRVDENISIITVS
jgi:hypothetical protein